MSENRFLNMIKTLREEEEVILHENILTFKDGEHELVIEYLRNQYDIEGNNYPHQKPPFHEQAALWGAQMAYIAAQLILYRKNEETELKGLFPEFKQELTPPIILSADLCLRFIPIMIRQLKVFDQEDHLIEVLEKIIQHWHYSGISYLESAEQLSIVKYNDACLMQLYANRIIRYKNTTLAKHEVFSPWVNSSMGMHHQMFWPELELESHE